MKDKTIDPSIQEHFKQIRAWEEATESEIQDIKATMEPLERRLQAARERLDLIRRLMHLTVGPKEQDLGVQSRPSGSLRSPSSLPKARGTIEDHIEQILKQAGGPMHIKDIRQALIERAVSLPGRGDEANIILRLRRASDKFTRTGRGTYAAAELGLKEMPPLKQKRVIRRRRARKQ